MTQGIRTTFGNANQSTAYGQRGPVPATRPQFKIVVYTPKAFDDLQFMADALVEQSGVLIHFDKVEVGLKCRIVDYMNGLGYALGAQVEKISDDIVLYVLDNALVEKSTIGSSATNKWF